MSEHVTITLQPSGGEKETVKAGGFDVANTARPLAHNHGAGYRAIYDFGQPERSVFVVSTGQSGNPLSSHYEDYAEPWRDGRYLPMLTDRSWVEEGALGTLVLSRGDLCEYSPLLSVFRGNNEPRTEPIASFGRAKRARQVRIGALTPRTPKHQIDAHFRSPLLLSKTCCYIWWFILHCPQHIGS